MTDEIHSKTEIGKLDARVTELEKGQQTLIAGMSRIETIASQLMDNQKGVFGRLNRPWQWSLVVAIFLGLFTISGGFATALCQPAAHQACYTISIGSGCQQVAIPVDDGSLVLGQGFDQRQPARHAQHEYAGGQPIGHGRVRPDDGRAVYLARGQAGGR